MNLEEREKILRQEKIAELMDNVYGLREAEEENGQIYTADVLGKCFHWLHRLHQDNVAVSEENDAMSEHWRLHYAGLAMQGYVSRDTPCSDETIARLSFEQADVMVDYGKEKEKDKTKCTSDGTGSTSSEDSNRE